MEYYTEGKRGKIFLDVVKGKKVVIKKEKRGLGRIDNEAKWLRKLNKYKIGPKLIKSGKDYIVYHFVEGEYFIDYYRKNGKKASVKFIKDVLKQCRTMDKLKVSKFEMHNPVKHIIVDKKAVQIDFERCTKMDKPKNVTQFVQFLVKIGFVKRTKKLTDLLKEYKGKQTDKNYRALVRFLF